MSDIYVDTSALLSLLDRDDARHEAVVDALSGLADDRAHLITTSYTIVESGALVRRRLGVKSFNALGRVISDSVEIVWVDSDLHWRAWRQAGKSAGRGPGLVDWVGIITMQDLKIKTALALDRHFQKQGFATVPDL